MWGTFGLCLVLESCSNGVVGIILHKIPAAVEPDAGLEQLVHFVSELLLRAFLTYIGSIVPFTFYVGPICQSQTNWTYLSESRYVGVIVELALPKRNRELAVKKLLFFSLFVPYPPARPRVPACQLPSIVCCLFPPSLCPLSAVLFQSCPPLSPHIPSLSLIH